MGLTGTAANMVASVSKFCVVAIPSGRSRLRFHFVKCRPEGVGINGRAAVGISLRRTASDLRRMIIITCNTRGGIAVAKSMTSIGVKDLGAPITGLDGTLRNGITNVVSMRSDNRPKCSGSAFAVHKVNAFAKGASPLMVMSNIRHSSIGSACKNTCGGVSPRSVIDVSLLGSTSTATMCNTGNTGNIVVVAAGHKSMNGPGVSVGTRANFAGFAGIPRVLDNISCVVLCGRDHQGSKLDRMCSHRRVLGARDKLSPCLCPGIS